MNTIGNKKLELFDMGAGASEPTAEDNVQLASGKMFIGNCDWDQWDDSLCNINWNLFHCIFVFLSN